VTVKAHAFASTLGAVQPLLGDATTVVTVQNGIPWWYKHMSGLPGDAAAAIDLSCVDPEGVIWNTVRVVPAPPSSNEPSVHASRPHASLRTM
jgi:2-dehydropantoate 2-reductase